METQLKTSKKRREIVDLQISSSEIPPKKKGRNRRSLDIFFRGLNRRSVRRRTVSAKESYVEINKTGPPN